MRTTFTQLVGCEVPVQQAPIGFAAALPALPIAVARAGGHGMLAGVRMPVGDLALRLREINAAVRSYGVNLILPLADEETLETAAALAPLVELYLGGPTAALVSRLHSNGALVSWQIVSAHEARAAVDAGSTWS